MIKAEAARRSLIAPTEGRPAIIAHKAGNTATQALAAIEDVADFVEVDLFVNRGRFEARHERRIFSHLPFLVDSNRVALAPRKPFGLKQLLDKAEGHIGVFLDLKNGSSTAARLVKKSIEESGYRGRLVASSQIWSILRALHHEAPEVDLFYSIAVRSQLDLFISVSQRDMVPRGVSIRHTLLTPELVREFHRRDLLVVAWTVDDVERAAELAEMGVDGITTHRVAEIRERVLR